MFKPCHRRVNTFVYLLLSASTVKAKVYVERPTRPLKESNAKNEGALEEDADRM